jgi:hypothetical protein
MRSFEEAVSRQLSAVSFKEGRVENPPSSYWFWLIDDC